MARKLAPGSLRTEDDQIRFYREVMGDEKTDAQVRAARLERGACICRPRMIKRRWDDATVALNRMVHDRDCPRWKEWMGEATS